jgi:hypothetical protein
MCASLADDVQWVNWRGEPLGTRQAVEDEHAKLFAVLYKNTRRTDAVKTIRYLSADLAVVDDYWTMTGARKRDGSDWPYRAGYSNFVMAKRGRRQVAQASACVLLIFAYRKSKPHRLKPVLLKSGRLVCLLSVNDNYFLAFRYQSRISSPVQCNTPSNFAMYS